MSDEQPADGNGELDHRVAAQVTERLREEATLDRLADAILDEARLSRMQARTGSELHGMHHRILDVQFWLRRVFFRSEAMLDVLEQSGIRDLRRKVVERERAKMLELLGRPESWAGLGILVERDGDGKPEAEVDCRDRHAICRGACCHMDFALTIEEVQAGIVAWDANRPFNILRGPDGYCVHWDRETHLCGIHEHRPEVCRRYTCRQDKRIWADFEARKLGPDFEKRIHALRSTATGNASGRSARRSPVRTRRKDGEAGRMREEHGDAEA